MFAEAARFQPVPRAVEWAIWFHDFVYDPGSFTNEEDSAVVARGALREMGEDAHVIERTVELILATKHGSAGACEDDDAKLLVSLDLAILAAPPEEYDAYGAQVRAEYAHVPEEQFRAGRAAFMRRFLAQARIFPHPGFAGYEARARANIERELIADSA
jgi:predicted metal-dependent HD superfamily phosphohydrolase